MSIYFACAATLSENNSAQCFFCAESPVPAMAGFQAVRGFEIGRLGVIKNQYTYKSGDRMTREERDIAVVRKDRLEDQIKEYKDKARTYHRPILDYNMAIEKIVHGMISIIPSPQPLPSDDELRDFISEYNSIRDELDEIKKRLKE